MTEKESTLIRGINYWFVSVPYEESLIKFSEVKNEELSHLFKHQGSTLGVISFYSDYDNTFVKKANDMAF